MESCFCCEVGIEPANFTDAEFLIQIVSY
jgi:hypothetical protein